MTSPQISVHNLSLNLGNKPVLSGLNFAIARGQFIGLIGPNGAGKSSLLRCLYRYWEQTEGEILYAGKPVSDYLRRAYARQVAVVLQEIPSQFNLALFEVVAMGVTPHKTLFSTVNADDKLRILEAIERVGLSHKAQQQFDSLSGGEKQRAMIARAMVQQPELLIMDEPTSHLDVKYQIQIMELAKAMGVTVIASFHDLNLAAALSDELLVLAQGTLVAQGTPLEIITPDLLSDIFGVCAEVETVPGLHSSAAGVPHIRYHYGYQL
ncbi:ABC transporter ATP-binding protein [Pseudoalteromonas sp. DL2-H2.2]|uniref:ABC transporter ATP-binding protein n=1 Tax=Pseudoalteromonas sp. DL2-H2.2 TaxID=2908889 RepID=UPI001F1E3201|nr:ABC transporter ATP-binding protein [Pseudoalteromonas sp. DL2-H2.2]MCF2907405.1 ABC transporter ATP-binding protein [Pseudoalteromonas sp. DL2-H2.2]